MRDKQEPTEENQKNKLALDVFNAILDTSRLQDKKLQLALSGIPIHPAQYSCLFVICQQEGLNLRELSQLLHIENSTASVSVRRMEKAGLIERRADESDCRMTRLYPTEYGKEQFESSKRIIAEFIQQSFGGLSEQELFTLRGLLGRVLARLGQYHSQPQPI